MRNLKIILNEDVYNLGEEGDVREVAPGYARNYLIPKGMAVLHSRENVARFKDKHEVIERRREEKRTSALGLKDRIEEMQLEFAVPAGSSGKLFGSITNAAIADRLMQDGLTIERKKIEIPGHTFKQVGDYEVIIKLYADESAALKVKIIPEGGETKPTGEAPPKSDKKARQDEPKQEDRVEVSEEVESQATVDDSEGGGAAVEVTEKGEESAATEPEADSAAEAEGAAEVEADSDVEPEAKVDSDESVDAEASDEPNTTDAVAEDDEGGTVDPSADLSANEPTKNSADDSTADEPAGETGAESGDETGETQSET